MIFRRLKNNLTTTIALTVAFSAALHLLVIFYSPFVPIQLSSKGEAQVILLEHVKEQPPVVVENNNKKQTIESKLNPVVVKETKKESPKIKKKTSKVAKKIQAETPPPKKSSAKSVAQTASQTQKATVSKGQQGDSPVKSDSPVEKLTYKDRVLNHFLSSASSSPCAGSAEVKLTLMRSGGLMGVEVIPIKGCDQYEKWVRFKALSANPYPPFLPDDRSKTRIETLHINNDSDD